MIKLIFPFSILLMLTLLSSECGQEDPVILYPTGGDNGSNILQEGEVEIISLSNSLQEHYYSFRAELAEGASLRIVMKNHSSSEAAVWFYDSHTNLDWEIRDYAYKEQKFIALGATCDLRLSFVEQGSADIEIYENGSEEPTRVKNISW